MRLRLAVFDMIGTTVQAGDEVPSAFREALGGDEEQVEAVYARFQDALRTAYRTRTRAVPGAEDLEAAAAARVGWSVGVLSGAHSRSQLEGRPHSVILESVESLPRWLEGAGAL